MSPAAAHAPIRYVTDKTDVVHTQQARMVRRGGPLAAVGTRPRFELKTPRLVDTANRKCTAYSAGGRCGAPAGPF
jgi:hypothetical protein